MAVLSKPVDESGQFDEEVKALTLTHLLEPSELRAIVDAVCVSWDRLIKIAGLIFRQLRLASALMFEHGAQRRHSLRRRLDQVKAELDGMK